PARPARRLQTDDRRRCGPSPDVASEPALRLRPIAGPMRRIGAETEFRSRHAPYRTAARVRVAARRQAGGLAVSVALSPFRRLASQCVARSAHSRLAPRGARCNSGRRHIVWGMTKGGSGKAFNRMALLASPTERAQEAAEALAACADWVPIEQAEVAVVLGGDGFMLETMHRMIEVAQLVPLYGLNLGTVGFLMNRYTKGCRIL